MADVYAYRNTTVADDPGRPFGEAWMIGIVVAIGLTLFTVFYIWHPRSTVVDTAPGITQAPGRSPSASTPSVIPIPIPGG